MYNYAGITYVPDAIVCEQHPFYNEAKIGFAMSPTYGKAIISGGMISPRGLVCPICYRVARYATPEEVAELHQEKK
jgi:hypothetical protein